MKFYLTLATALSLLGTVKAGLEDAKYSTVLTPSNFDNVIASQTEGTLVAFFAPWCGHCKNLEPVWTKIAEAFDGDDRCKVAHFNADDATARPISSKYGVQGFPTLKFLAPPSKGGQVDTYNGARSEEAFLEYLNEKCGTEKGKGGVLSNLAGRIPSLDNLAALYLSPSATRPALLASASALSSSLTTRASQMSAYYLKLMTKWAELAEDNVDDAKRWIEGESKRLEKLASRKGKVQVSKLEEAKMKQNILSVFASATSLVSSASSTASVVATDAASSASSAASQASRTVSSVKDKVTDRVKQEL
ncbi:hypothetical protein JCM10212_004516 [Sporobolomyces blumeae]